MSTIETPTEEAVREGLWEITQLSRALYIYIRHADAIGEIEPAARGILKRIADLSDDVALSLAPDGDADEADRATARAHILCGDWAAPTRDGD